MKQERSGRRERRSADEKQALLSAWGASGLSARAFAARAGVRTSSLWRWKRAAADGAKKSSAVPARSAITFAPVHITKTSPQRDLTITERAVAEVVLRDVRVRVLDGAEVEQVARLVRALAGGVAC